MRSRLGAILCFLAVAGSAAAQCGGQGTFTGVDTSTPVDNRTLGCYNWRVTYASTGFTALSIQLEYAPDVAGVPGTWAAFTGATVVYDGSNPSTDTNAATIGVHANASWLRIKLVSKTGTGTIKYKYAGASGVAPSAWVKPGATGITAVTASPPLASSGGTTPDISVSVAQGNGAKIQLSTGTTTTNDCVKFDANGNTVDAGAACAPSGVSSVAASPPLASSGGLTPTISVSVSQGNGTKLQRSTGTTTTDHCVKFDANGNTVDAGATCGTGGGSITAVTASPPLASSGGTTPNISVSVAQGNGAKIQLSTGTTTTNNCVKFDANGNTVDAGAACGTGSGGGYTLISSSVLGAPAATVTFASVTGYNNLHIVIRSRCTAAIAADVLLMQVNGDTATNYSLQALYGLSATPGTFENVTTSTSAGIGYIPCASALANAAASTVIEIPGYAGTTFTKEANSISSRIGGAAISTNYAVYDIAWHWQNTAAITSLVFSMGTGGNTIATGSAFYVYGY